MLTLIRDDVEYSLDDGSLAYYLGDEGWGMANLHRLSERGPLQDGDTDRGERLDPRYGSLLFEIVAENRTSLYAIRESFMTLFHPSEMLKLRWDLPAVGIGIGGAEYPAISRQFDVLYHSDMDFPSAKRTGYSQKFTVTMKANDPTCYDPNPIVLTFSGGGGAGMPFPLLVPITFGASAMNATIEMDQLGNADDYPIIRIVGPITNPIITNLTYGMKLDFTGITIGAGVTYEIDLRYGHKTVIELPSTNRVNQLSTDSDLSTWRLVRGDNDVSAQGTSITAATKVLVTYYKRYLGV